MRLRRPLRLLPVLAAAFLLPMASASAAQPPKVVASIAPLHSLAASVMAGVGQPDLLLPAQTSPHDFSLKPSQAQALRKADLVLWVGPRLESFLKKPLAGLSDKGRQLAMAELPGVVSHEVREGGPWETHEHHHEHEGHDQAKDGEKHAEHDEHGELEIDGHMWLDVANATLFAEVLASRLAALDPANGEKYRKNAEDLKTRLAALDGDLKKEMAGLAGKPFVVYHDAFQYFEKRYGLSGAGSITLDERKPSAKKLAAIKKKIAELKAVCVFREPQAPARLAELAAEGTSAKLGVLDALGSGQTVGPDLYTGMLKGVAASLKECLAK